MTPRSALRSAHRVLVALFFVAITAPGVIHLLTQDEVADLITENRRPAARPALPRDLAGWQALPKALETYYADFVRGRTALLASNHALRRAVLGMTPPGSSTITGPNGWIFFTGNDALEQHRGRKPWTPQMIERACRALEKRRSELAREGIRYLFVIAPDKMTIYPEELPDWALPFSPRTPADQLMEAVAARGLEDLVLDLRPILREKKRERLLYYPYGTHWNQWGAYYAYRAIASRLGPQVFGPSALGSAVLEPEQLEVRNEVDLGDSWGRIWHIPSLLLQPVPMLELPERFRSQMARSWWPYSPLASLDADHRYLTPKPPGSQLLIVHDSFWEQLKAFVTSHFAATAACSSYLLDPSLAGALAPQLVLHLSVERNLFVPFEMDLLLDPSLAGALAPQLVLHLSVERNLFVPFEMDLLPPSASAWLAHEEISGTYTNPSWGTVEVRESGPQGAHLTGQRFGSLELRGLLPGVYTGVSPLVGPLRFVLFRESGARHLVVLPAASAQHYSFLSPSLDAPGEAAHARWQGEYERPGVALHLRGAGSALWCFDAGGVLTHVLEPEEPGSSTFTDPRDAHLLWIFDATERAGASLRVHARTGGEPVEMRRR